nr:nematocyst expressed protein 3-like [Oryctolagus cuniculus]
MQPHGDLPEGSTTPQTNTSCLAPAAPGPRSRGTEFHGLRRAPSSPSAHGRAAPATPGGPARSSRRAPQACAARVARKRNDSFGETHTAARPGPRRPGTHFPAESHAAAAAAHRRAPGLAPAAAACPPPAGRLPQREGGEEATAPLESGRRGEDAAWPFRFSQAPAFGAARAEQTGSTTRGVCHAPIRLSL